LALAVAYLPPEPERSADFPERRSTAEKRRLDQLNNAYGETQELLAAVRFRDSLHRILVTRHDSAGGVEIAFRMELPQENYALVRAAAQRLWRSLNPVPGARLIIILGSGRRWRSSYLLPEALDGRSCVASISLEWGVGWLRTRSRAAEIGTNLEPWLRDAVAPCLYYTAFGSPGSEIEAWLTRRSFAPAYTADWNAPPPTLRFEDDPSRYDYLIYNASFDALACTDGRRARCAPALLDRPEFYGRSSIKGMVHRYFFTRSVPGEDHYLATLVHDMGRDRFARFWRSSEPAEEAFAAAFGQPMDQWTAMWARNVAPDLPPFGPAPRPIAVLYAVGLAALAAGLAAAAVMRRQVS